jgi:hypothetical protein
MSGYSFWCSKCKVDHPGECPPGLDLLEGALDVDHHSWVAQPVIDLSCSYKCSKCGAFCRFPFSFGDIDYRLPVGPCYGQK